MASEGRETAKSLTSLAKDTVRVTRTKKAWWQSHEAVAALFLLPNVLGFLVFYVGPIVASSYISLNRWDLLTSPQFVGLKNYQTLFFEDDLFWKSLGNTFYYSAIVIPGTLAVSLLLAVACNQPLKGIKVFRTIYFIPVVSSMIAVAMAFRWLYSYDWGLINHMLRLVHLPPVKWLGSPAIALPAVAAITVWKSAGYNMVLFLAGLQGIPVALYEAAEIDGANAFNKFGRITLPLLTPTIFFVTVMSVIGSFQVFGSVYIMTQGGPSNATMVFNYYLYLNAFRFLKFGLASALAWVLFAIIGVISLMQWYFFGRRVQYEMI